MDIMLDLEKSKVVFVCKITPHWAFKNCNNRLNGTNRAAHHNIGIYWIGHGISGLRSYSHQFSFTVCGLYSFLLFSLLSSYAPLRPCYLSSSPGCSPSTPALHPLHKPSIFPVFFFPAPSLFLFLVFLPFIITPQLCFSASLYLHLIPSLV